MGVVGIHVDKVSPHRDSTGVMARGIVEQPRTHRTRVVPQAPSGLRVDGECVVGRCKVHHSVDDHRSGFEPVGIAGMENPGSPQLGDIFGSNFVQAAVAASAVIAIVRRPIRSDRPEEQVFRV